MISAKEAREQTKKCYQIAIAQQLSEINDKVISSTNNHLYTMDYCGILPEVKQRLEELGYKLEFDGVRTIISWYEKEEE